MEYTGAPCSEVSRGEQQRTAAPPPPMDKVGRRQGEREGAVVAKAGRSGFRFLCRWETVW